MPTQELFLEVLNVEADLNRAQLMIDNKRNTLIGKLPLVRSKLDSMQIDVDARRIQIEAAKTYLQATTQQ